MSLATIQCPHCGRELNVPEDAGQIVCMYCAKPVDVNAIMDERQHLKDGFETVMGEAERALSRELFTIRLDPQRFNSSNYPLEFEKYKALFQPALDAFQQSAFADEDAAAERFADLLFQNFLTEMPGKKAMNFFDCRFTITSLTIPAILSLNTEAADKTVDCFLAKWKQKFPKDSLGKATYEKIQEGFKKKLCYITTAVCSSLGAEDDCTELNEFRAFRDRWLAKAQDGKAKIAEYYLFAPLIVQKIGQSGQAQREYHRIWSDYLVPCLDEIRAGRQDECARDYEKMVRTLEQKWLS